MTSRADPRGGRRWRRLRAHLIATTPRPVMCWRCEQEITDVDAAELGHVTDYATALPGEPVRLALEHRACNRAAGYALARELQRKPRHPNRAWTTTELPERK